MFSVVPSWACGFLVDLLELDGTLPIALTGIWGSLVAMALKTGRDILPKGQKLGVSNKASLGEYKS
jgi:hypothetical protein